MAESKARKQQRAALVELQVTATQLANGFDMRRLSFAEMRSVLRDIETQARELRRILVDET
jgi:allophanate hydrolase subunit 1